MKQNQNSRRTNQLAREKLATIMLFEVSDPDLQLVTITGVEVSVDRSFMRAYVSCDASRYEEVSVPSSARRDASARFSATRSAGA